MILNLIFGPVGIGIDSCEFIRFGFKTKGQIDLLCRDRCVRMMRMPPSKRNPVVAISWIVAGRSVRQRGSCGEEAVVLEQ